MVAIAVCVRSKADAAKAKKPPVRWLLSSPRVKLAINGCCRDLCRSSELEDEDSGRDEEVVSATGSREKEVGIGEVAGVE